MSPGALSAPSALFLVGVGGAEDARPADFAVEERMVFVERDEHTPGSADDVVFRYEAPIARIERVVAVVAHHEVVILAEGVGVFRFAADVEMAVAESGVGIVLIHSDGAAVDVPSLLAHADGDSILGYPQAVGAAVVGACPAGRFRGREER